LYTNTDKDTIFVRLIKRELVPLADDVLNNSVGF